MVGEEYGGDFADTSGARWVVDPIDGTRSFIRGYETWACLIALQHDGSTVGAVASVPALGQRYAAARGEGATVNGKAIHVSAIDRVDAAMLAHTSVSGFVRVGHGRAPPRPGGALLGQPGHGQLPLPPLGGPGHGRHRLVGAGQPLGLRRSGAHRRGGRRPLHRPERELTGGGAGVSSNGLLHEVALEAAGLK